MMSAGMMPEPSRTTVFFPVDPQLDSNVLIKLVQGVPEFVAYVQTQ
jgi:hypothetical protein